MNKFEQTGSVLNIHPPGRPVSVADQATKDEIFSILEEEPQTSTHRMSLQLNIARRSYHSCRTNLSTKKYEVLLVPPCNNVKCIQFRPRTSSDSIFITFRSLDGCYSYVCLFFIFLLDFAISTLGWTRFWQL